MMWWTCCAVPREKTTRVFTFKGGTRVKAHDSVEAFQILKSISLRDVPKAFHVDANTWVIEFGKGVSIEVREQEMAPARKLGEWRVYLDRRDLELIP